VGRARRGAGQRGDDVAAVGPLAAAPKKKTIIPREQDDAERQCWRDELADTDPQKLIFLDETHTPLTLTPLRARAPRGERAVGRVPRGGGESVTLVATLTPGGMGPAMTVSGALDQAAFEAFVETELVPVLQPGQTVVLDNLRVHRSRAAHALIAAAGCTLRFLPRYSPDLNPIEQAFSNVKTHLRRSQPRTTERVIEATAQALASITPADVHGYFQQAGYPLT
jgi:transposase